MRLTATDDGARVEAAGLELMAGAAGPVGRGDWWLPEELLVAAVSASLLDTVRTLAHEERLALGNCSCVGETAPQRRSTQPFGLTLRLSIEVAPADVPRLDGVLRRAKDACVLARALAVPLELQLTPISSH